MMDDVERSRLRAALAGMTEAVKLKAESEAAHDANMHDAVELLAPIEEYMPVCVMEAYKIAVAVLALSPETVTKAGNDRPPQ